MLFNKNRHPVVSLLIGLCALVVLFMMMQDLQRRVQEISNEGSKIVEYDLGRTYFPKEMLEPFAKYSGNKNFSDLKESIEVVFDQIDRATRPEFKSYIALQSPWLNVFESTYKYVGVLLPAYPVQVEKNETLPSMKKGTWLRMKLKQGLELNVLCAELPEGLSKDESYYLDTFFLGQFMLEGGKREAFAIAKKLYHLPNKGVYPRLKSDEDAHREIVDSMDDPPDEVQKVSSLAFYHYLAKVQEGEIEKEEIAQGVRYSDLMQSAVRYRGKVMEFTGSFIHFMRRKMPSDQIRPGMEFYYQCYLKDNRRRQIVFRSLYLPEDIQIHDLVKVRGYFLQRHNFVTRMKQWKWVPMLIVDKVEKVAKPKYGLTKNEKNGLMVVMAIFFLLVIYILFFMKRASAKASRPKEKLELKKEKVGIKNIKKIDFKKTKKAEELKDASGGVSEEKPQDPEEKKEESTQVSEEKKDDEGPSEKV